jgi:hypothetical protein
MSFSSMDDLISELTSGKTTKFEWNKFTGAAAYTAGRWYDFSPLGGSPIANAWAGTGLAWTTCTETTGNGTQVFGIPNGGNVSADTKHILNVLAVTAVSTGVPSQLMLVDLQGYWPGINCNSSSIQTLTGTPSLRYANGAGCRLYTVTTATTGATAHNIAISYTNQAGTSGKTLPSTVSMTPSAIVPHIGHSGTGTNNFGPFLPLADGDTGVQNVANVQFSQASGTTGATVALCLARPLLTIPLVTAAIASERDLLNQLPSLPRVVDGACLTWLFYAGAATAASTNFFGSVEYVWG